tara:strand:+ start:914 stop:1201 length:288 start_codon:yes stop_codon:yes gene_type:complete
MFKVTADKYDIAFTFRHTRDTNFVIKPNKVVTDITSCLLTVNTEQFNTLAACVSGDAFNKATGRTISLTKALYEAQLPRPVRAAVWKAYWNRGDR